MHRTTNGDELTSKASYSDTGLTESVVGGAVGRDREPVVSGFLIIGKYQM